MIKLVRNCFAECKVLTNSEGNQIKWFSVEKLAELQGPEAATKLTTKK